VRRKRESLTGQLAQRRCDFGARPEEWLLGRVMPQRYFVRRANRSSVALDSFD
jgi:hypothetical protein